jgi:hypothetical protein
MDFEEIRACTCTSFSRELKAAVRKADNLDNIMCRFSGNYGSLNLLYPEGPV